MTFQDKTARLIIGIILILTALPAISMAGWGGYGGYGMMRMMGAFSYGFGSYLFGIIFIMIAAAIFSLGLYLIIESVKK